MFCGIFHIYITAYLLYTPQQAVRVAWPPSDHLTLETLLSRQSTHTQPLQFHSTAVLRTLHVRKGALNVSHKCIGILYVLKYIQLKGLIFVMITGPLQYTLSFTVSWHHPQYEEDALWCKV